MESKKVEISYKTIVFAVLFVALIWVLYLIRDIIFQFFLALLITAALNPTVNWFEKHKIPRAASVLLVYLILFTIVGVTVAAIVPELIIQTSAFISNFPRIIENIGISASVFENLVQQILLRLGSLPADVARVSLSLFTNVIGLVAIMIFSFYLLSERKELGEQLESLVGKKWNDIIEKNLALLEKKLGSWTRAELTLMFMVGASHFVGLTLLGIPFALPLGILAGLLEVVPFVGPIVAAVPVTLIGFGISPILGLAAVALAFLIQQIENYVFVPKIMERSTGVHPVITLLSIAIGFELFGL